VQKSSGGIKISFQLIVKPSWPAAGTVGDWRKAAKGSEKLAAWWHQKKKGKAASLGGQYVTRREQATSRYTGGSENHYQPFHIPKVAAGSRHSRAVLRRIRAQKN
jgi:hypothetical protein